MKNSKLFNAGMGKVITLGNTDEECEEEFDRMMDMTVEEALQYIMESAPKGMLKLKFSTLMDLLVHGEDFLEDLDLDEDDEE